MSLWGQASSKPPTSVDELLDPAIRAALIGLDIEARRLLASPRHGERRSTRRGSSVEFADFRPYAPSDDLRRVDWNVYARLDALVVKLFQDEEDLLTVLAVDDSASMVFGEPCKHVFARRLAMCIGIIALGAGHRTSCQALASSALASQTLRGRAGVGGLARWVLDLQGNGQGNLAADLRRVANAIPGRAKLIVLTDGLQQGDALPEALASAGARGHDTHVIQLLSPQECQPLQTGLTGDHRLVDAETGDGPAVSVTASIEAAYRRRLQAHVEMLENACRCSGAHHTLVHTDASIEALLRQRLRRGGLLR